MTDLSAMVGARLRMFRRGRRATQEYVAGQMQAAGFGWSSRTVRRVEAGERALTLDEFCVLAAVIGAEPSEFWPRAS